MDPWGNFTGRLEGTFSAAGGTVSGRMEASVTGTVVDWVPGFLPDTWIPIHMVTDVGRWELTRGGGLQGEGTLNLTLEGIVGVPAGFWGGLEGGGSLLGVVEVKD